MNALDSIDWDQIHRDAQRADELRTQCCMLARQHPYPLLARPTSNTKIRKSMRIDYRLTSLSLAHGRESGHNVCEQASAACLEACVGSANVGLAQVFGDVMQGRIKRTRFLMEDRQTFIVVLVGELEVQRRLSAKAGQTLACRLNCFSDLPWHEPAFGCIPQLFPTVQFFDYTKVHKRILNEELPENWHVVGSWSELKRHQDACVRLLTTGHNVAMPFSESGSFSGSSATRQRMPKRHRIDGRWFEVINGDEHDLLFLRPGPTRSGAGRIIGLALKAGTTAGREAAIEQGFSVHAGERT